MEYIFFPKSFSFGQFFLVLILTIPTFRAYTSRTFYKEPASISLLFKALRFELYFLFENISPVIFMISEFFSRMSLARKIHFKKFFFLLR